MLGQPLDQQHPINIIATPWQPLSNEKKSTQNSLATLKYQHLHSNALKTLWQHHSNTLATTNQKA